MGDAQAESAVLVAARQLAEEARERHRPGRALTGRGRAAGRRPADAGRVESDFDLGMQLVARAVPG